MSKPIVYVFGPFRLDLAQRTLFRNGLRVTLQRKTFETLVLLVENSGRVVEKEDFFKAVWSESFVEDGSLTVNISLLRKTLGDDQNGQKFIETVPRRGYRFVAPVRVEVVPPARVNGQAEHPAAGLPTAQLATVELPTAEVNDAVDIAAHPPPRPVSRRKYYVIGAAAVVAIALCYWLWPVRPRTIAVLPLNNLKPDLQTDYLSYALSEAIMTKLGSVRLPDLMLVSTVYHPSNQTPDPHQAAAQLQTDLLLAGNYLKQGDGLQITVRLIETASRQVQWQETFDIREEPLPQVLDQAARRVMTALGARLTAAQARLLEADLARDPVAYVYYLYGIDHYAAERFDLPIELLEKSVALDPDYPRAWDYLGSAYAVSASTRFGGRAHYEKAQAAFRKAIDLNPAQPRPHVFLADLLIETNRVEEAVPQLLHVLARDPQNALAQWELSYAYRYGGLLEESIE